MGVCKKKVIFFVNKIKCVKSINRGRVGRCRQWEDDKSAIKSNHCVALSRGATVIEVAVQKYCTVFLFCIIAEKIHLETLISFLSFSTWKHSTNFQHCIQMTYQTLGCTWWHKRSFHSRLDFVYCKTCKTDCSIGFEFVCQQHLRRYKLYM